MTPEQRAALQAWKDAQGTEDTIKLTHYCNGTGGYERYTEDTVTETVTRADAEQVAEEQAMIAAMAQFGEAPPFNSAARRRVLTILSGAIDAEPDTKQAVKKLKGGVEMLAMWLGIGEAVFDKHMGQSSYDRDVTRKVKLPSPAEEILGREVTAKEIESLA